MKIMAGEGELLDLVGALRALSRLTDLLDGGDEQADENSDDGNDDQQLDQRKRQPWGGVASWHRQSPCAVARGIGRLWNNLRERGLPDAVSWPNNVPNIGIGSNSFCKRKQEKTRIFTNRAVSHARFSSH